MRMLWMTKLSFTFSAASSLLDSLALSSHRVASSMEIMLRDTQYPLNKWDSRSIRLIMVSESSRSFFFLSRVRLACILFLSLLQLIWFRRLGMVDEFKSEGPSTVETHGAWERMV